MATSVQSQHTPRRASLLAVFALGHFSNDLAPVSMILIIPAFGAAFGLSPIEIGLLFALHTAGAAIAYLPAGIAADRVADRGRLLLATFFWVGLGYLAASQAEGIWAFAILIAFAGAGDAAWHPLAIGVLAQHYKRQRGFAIGVHAIGGYLAQVLALIFAGFLLIHTGWRTTLQIMALPALIMGIFFVLFVARIPRIDTTGQEKLDIGEIWRPWATATGVRLLAFFAAYNMGFFAILTMTPVFLKTAHQFAWNDTALVMAAMMVLGAFAQPLLGRVSDAIGRTSLLIGGNLVAAIAAFAAGLTPLLVVTLVALGIALTMLSGIRAVVLAAAVDHVGTREGSSIGLAFVFSEGVSASAAVLAGLVGEYDLQYAFLLAGAFSLVAVALATPFLNGERA